jgi:hypothetical protein
MRSANARCPARRVHRPLRCGDRSARASGCSPVSGPDERCPARFTGFKTATTDPQRVLRNSTHWLWLAGRYPRIAQQIALAFGIPLNKDAVRRILAAQYQPRPDSAAPSWLTVPTVIEPMRGWEVVRRNRSRLRGSLARGIHSYRWQPLRRGLYHTPIAARGGMGGACGRHLRGRDM